MLLQIDIQWESWFFYWNSKWIDVASWELYKSNILPCKTTILWMLCYFYGIEFEDLDSEWKELKYSFINDFKYWITNKSNNLEKETKTYTSSYNRTIWWRPQLFIKEYIKNINFILYIYIEDNSLLLEYITKSIKDNNYWYIPWLWDKNLFPDIFDVNIINNDNINIVNNFEWELLTNVFESKWKYYIDLWRQKEYFLLSYNRINYQNEKKDFIVWCNIYKFDFDIIDENIIIIDNKWIILY